MTQSGQVPGGNAYVHVGCSDDRPAQDGFAEVRRWLLAHRDQFVVLYLENQLYPDEPVATSEQAHQVAAALIQQYFGDLAYRPAGVSPGHCATIPYGTSRARMMATGARVEYLTCDVSVSTCVRAVSTACSEMSLRCTRSSLRARSRLA